MSNSNLSNTYRLVSIKSIVSDYYTIFDSTNPDIFTEDQILETASRAAHMLYNHKLYEESICITGFNNYTITLPPYRKIKSVFFKHDLSESEYSSLVSISDTVISEGESQTVVKYPVSYKKADYVNNWIMAFPKHNLSGMINMKQLQR
jgi:hypothetical protein